MTNYNSNNSFARKIADSPQKSADKIKSTAAKVGPRPSRPPSTDERDFCLPIWRAAQAAGEEGVCKLHFREGTGPCNGRRVTEVPRLVNSLEAEGYQFLHLLPKDRNSLCLKCNNTIVHFALVAEPLEPRKPVQPEHQGHRFGFGKNLRPEPEAQQSMFPKWLQFETGARR